MNAKEPATPGGSGLHGRIRWLLAPNIIRACSVIIAFWLVATTGVMDLNPGQPPGAPSAVPAPEGGHLTELVYSTDGRVAVGLVIDESGELVR